MRLFPGLLLSLAVPLTANAALMEVTYTGRVTFAANYDIVEGATVAGVLTYDTDLIGVDQDGALNAAIYGPGQFVTGFVPVDAPGFAKDHLYLWDQAYGGVADRFEIGDEYEYALNDGAGNTYNLQEGIRLSASAALLNFIIGSGPLQSFTLSALDGLDVFSGILHRQEIRTENGVVTLFDSGFALFELDQLSVTTSVPEPATLGLLSIGLIGAALSRRRRRVAQ